MTSIPNDQVPAESSDDIEQLTAYLDGELGEDETRLVEKRIAQDAQYRLQMQSLQKTWDLLDELPSESADSSFTRTTLEIVVSDAVREIRSDSHPAWKQPLTLFTLTALPVILFAGSFFSARQTQFSERQRSIDNLPVIEKMDHYLAAGLDLDFLKALHQSGLFSDESTLWSPEHDDLPPSLFEDAASPSGSATTSVNQLSQLNEMDPLQRDTLLRRRDRFVQLPEQEQKSLRGFHRQLAADEKATELRKTLNDYYDWLGTLQSRERAELADMPPVERLSGVTESMISNARREFGRSGMTQLPSRDARAVFDWYDQTSREKEDTIRQQYAELVQSQNMDKQRIILDAKLAELTQRPLNQLVGVLIRVDRDSIKEMLFANLDALRPNLSEEALAILDSQTANGKQELLLQWTEAANQTRSKVTTLQLQKFYEQLSIKERDELHRLSFDNWKQELTRRWREIQLLESAPADDLSDEKSVQTLIEESGLEIPDRPEDEVGVTEEDMGMPLNLEIDEEELNMEPRIRLRVPDELQDPAPASELESVQ